MFETNQEIAKLKDMTEKELLIQLILEIRKLQLYVRDSSATISLAIQQKRRGF